MKKFTHLVLDDKGLKAIVAPEYPEPKDTALEYKITQWYKETGGYLSINEWYKKALQQAIADGVYFNLNVGMQNIWHHKYEKGKLYPIPDGYEVKIVTTHELYSDNIDEQYATLVPKEKCKEYCNCAKEAMTKGANRDWVDATQDKCPLKPIEKGAGDDYPVVKQWEDTEQNRLLFDKVTNSTCPKLQSIEEAANIFSNGFQLHLKLETVKALKEGFIAGANHLMNELIEDIVMNYDDWCRTPSIMATKFRDKNLKQQNS